MMLTESAACHALPRSRGKETVLVVDDSPTVTHVMSRTLATEFGYRVLVAENYAGCDRILDQARGDISVAVADLNLPDATHGEVVDLIRSADIPVIVLTGAIDEQLRKAVIGKDIVDYVLKLDRRAVEYGAALVHRIVRNKYTKVLVAEAAASSRRDLVRILKRLLLQTFEAETGDQVMDIVARHADIQLLLLGYDLPVINGEHLIRSIREHYRKDRMSIIALSGDDDRQLIINMLKSGANDFIRRPYAEEEFCVRIHANLEVLDLFRHIHDKADKDSLTGLFNRSYWYDNAPKFLGKFQKLGQPAVLAMIDIDHCKHLNDEYGYGAVDIALVELARMLRESLPPTALVARLRGDEFCVLVGCDDAKEILDLLENYRHNVASHWIEAPTQRFQLTVSIGATTDEGNAISAIMARADQHLRLAKERGANRTIR